MIMVMMMMMMMMMAIITELETYSSTYFNHYL
jgi:hypothetical protein